MAFPRLNMASFWLTFGGAILLAVSLFVPGGPEPGDGQDIHRFLQVLIFPGSSGEWFFGCCP